MTRADERSSPAARPGVLRLACLLALTAGMVDLSVALLAAPRDFEAFASLVPPLLATAAAFLVVHLALWAGVRPLARRAGFHAEPAAAAVGAFVLTCFTLALLAGLHTAPVTAGFAFRAGMIAAVAAVLCAGVYAIATMASPATERGGWETAGQAMPPVLLAVLAYEWLMVYAIGLPLSASGLLASAALIVVVAATIASFRFARRAANRAAAVVGLAFVAVPMAGGVLSDRSPAARAAGEPGTPRHIVLISIDSLRADAVSAYSAGPQRTAAIDALASEAVVFERAIATAPWTLPSLASMLTGLSPSVHLVTGMASRLSDRITTLAESLGARGYRTAALVHNPLLGPDRGFAQGFDDYIDLHEPSYGGAVGIRLLQATLPSLYPGPPWPRTSDHTAVVRQWLDANGADPFFLWVHLFDPHLPYTPRLELVEGDVPPHLGLAFEGQPAISQGVLRPPPADQQWIRTLYEAETRDVDANVGRLIETLKQMGVYDESLIIVTSDHGEEFWEHGAQGHGHAMYDELLRVPLIVKLPGASVRGRRAPAVSTASITPTILELSGIRYDAGLLSAPSLASLLTTGEAGAEQPIVSNVVWTVGTLADGRDAVLFEGYKYILSRSPGGDQVFDLHADPGEQRSLAPAAPERLDAGRRLLARHLEAAAGLRTRLRIEQGSMTLDDDTLRQLRSLGYVQ